MRLLTASIVLAASAAAASAGSLSPTAGHGHYGTAAPVLTGPACSGAVLVGGCYYCINGVLVRL